MLKDIEFSGYKTSTKFHKIYEPEQCPMCKFDICPEMHQRLVYLDNNKEYRYFIVYVCTHCHRPFIAHYRGTHPEFLAPNRPESREFDPKINEVSPDFCSIYNQSLSSEALALDQISGMGYRKALEFLIKDYLIHKNPDEADTIRRMELGNCIANKVDNEKLKAVASRATWIGNDFTHYTRRFEEYEISDLKRFIDATLLWILMELTTDEALSIDSRR